MDKFGTYCLARNAIDGGGGGGRGGAGGCGWGGVWVGFRTRPAHSRT